MAFALVLLRILHMHARPKAQANACGRWESPSPFGHYHAPCRADTTWGPHTALLLQHAMLRRTTQTSSNPQRGAERRAKVLPNVTKHSAVPTSTPFRRGEGTWGTLSAPCTKNPPLSGVPRPLLVLTAPRPPREPGKQHGLGYETAD